MNTMQFLTGDKLSKAIRYILSGENISCAVAFWGRGMDQELDPTVLRKVNARIICDISMRATSAEALEGLGGPDNPNLRSMNRFHAKVYLSSHGAVIGSANASRNGVGLIDLVGGHVEAGVFHPQASQIWKQAYRWFDNLWKDDEYVLQITQDDIDYVRKIYGKLQISAAAPKTSDKGNLPTVGTTDLTGMDWETLESNIRYGQLKKEFEGRISFLQSLPRHLEFHDMDDMQRKRFAGTVSEAGMFGSMKGNGIFKSIVNKEPNLISDALKNIPLVGNVKKSDFVKFITSYRKAFVGKSNTGGYATASRILAMKRPDQFVCVDSANIDELSGNLGFKKGRLNLDSYWDLIVEPIRRCVWYNSTRPQDDLSGQIWDTRVAMIDSLYYKMDE